jgi:hypothetical protein
VILAHLHFLSGDLERASRLLDAYPSVCFDLAPGSEMYNNFSRHPAQARDFFLRYQDRLVYGSDTTSGAMEREGEKGVEWALGRAWVIRTFLESDRTFVPPEGLERWLEPDLDGFQGIALPTEALERIYRANFERIYGHAPAPLDPELALSEVRRMVDALDRRASGMTADNHARQVLATLRLT